MMNKKWTSKNTKRANEEFVDEPPFNGVPMFLNLSPPNNNEFQGPNFGTIRVVENHVYFYGDVDEQNALDLNRTLHEVDIKLQNTKNVLGDEYTPVIHLHLNTYGGGIYAAFSTVDVMKRLKSKIYTYVEGAVASAGTLLSSVGDKRFIGEHSHLLIHQLSGGMYGKFAELEEEMHNCTKLMKLLKDFYKKHTKIPMKKLDELLGRDLWLTPSEALQYGIVDEIK